MEIKVGKKRLEKTDFFSFFLLSCFSFFQLSAMSQFEELRILCNNAYLIPWFFVSYERWKGDNFGIHTCADQPQRAKRLGLLAKEYDVLILQELWGGASHNMAGGLEATHTFLERQFLYLRPLNSSQFFLTLLDSS